MVGDDLAGERVDLADALDLVAPQADAIRGLAVGRLHFEHVAAHAEASALQEIVVAVVVDLDQVAQNLVAAHHLAHAQVEHDAPVILRAAQAVDARDRGHDHHIAAAEERAGGGQAQAVDLLVDLRVLLDVGVGARDVRFRLVVVVVGDEVLDRVVGQKLAHLGVELRGQRLVVRHDQRRLLHLLDHLRHGVGLAAPRHPEQHLMLHPLADAVGQLRNRLRLVARWLELADNLRSVAYARTPHSAAHQDARTPGPASFASIPKMGRIVQSWCEILIPDPCDEDRGVGRRSAFSVPPRSWHTDGAEQLVRSFHAHTHSSTLFKTPLSDWETIYDHTPSARRHRCRVPAVAPYAETMQTYPQIEPGSAMFSPPKPRALSSPLNTAVAPMPPWTKCWRIRPLIWLST